MHTFLLGIFLVSIAMLVSTPEAAGQSRVAPECSDDNGVDRCSAEQHRRVLDLFGLNPIEEHVRAGDQVRRAFYVDGYGGDLLALSFVRAPGRDPRFTSTFPGSATVPEASR